MGLNKEVLTELWAEVMANRERFDSCPGPHRFVDVSPDKTLGKRFRCETCGGETDATQRNWYERGLEHGRREFIHLMPPEEGRPQ